MKTVHMLSALLLLTLASCSKSSDSADSPSLSTLYFPPDGTAEWQTLSPEMLGWNTANLPGLYTYLEQEDTRGFLILKNGKIVVERYFGQNILGTGPFGSTSVWQWASAGKTLTGFVVGLAQQEGLLRIEEKTSKYLGTGWTSAGAAKEDLITIRHQLTMTSGLDDFVAQPGNTAASALKYKADAGTRWAYHNAPYSLLQDVVTSASGQSFESYFDTKLKNRVGMEGQWRTVDFDHVFFSTPRSMARFGLLIQAKGGWNGTAILSDQAYLNASVNTSQQINPAYGYLWWLNGKTSFMVPQSQMRFQGFATPNAPADLIAAMGKDGQLLNIVPSMGLVVVRMGGSADTGLVSLQLQDELWGKLKEIIR